MSTFNQFVQHFQHLRKQGITWMFNTPLCLKHSLFPKNLRVQPEHWPQPQTSSHPRPWPSFSLAFTSAFSFTKNWAMERWSSPAAYISAVIPRGGGSGAPATRGHGSAVSREGRRRPNTGGRIGRKVFEQVVGLGTHGQEIQQIPIKYHQSISYQHISTTEGWATLHNEI